MEKQKFSNPYITPVNTILAALNIIVFFVLDLMGDTEDAVFMLAHGAMYPPAVLLEGQWYRLLTSAFLHFGFQHLVNNMIMLVCLGSYLERALGKVKYIIFYLAAAVGSSLVSLGIMLYTGNIAVSAGASGAIFGIIGALLYMLIRNRGRFADLTMVRFLLMIALSLYYGFSSTGVDNAAHVGGLVIGFVLGIILYRKDRHYRYYHQRMH